MTKTIQSFYKMPCTDKPGHVVFFPCSQESDIWMFLNRPGTSKRSMSAQLVVYHCIIAFFSFSQSFKTTWFSWSGKDVWNMSLSLGLLTAALRGWWGDRCTNLKQFDSRRDYNMRIEKTDFNGYKWSTGLKWDTVFYLLSLISIQSNRFCLWHVHTCFFPPCSLPLHTLIA